MNTSTYDILNDIYPPPPLPLNIDMCCGEGNGKIGVSPKLKGIILVKRMSSRHQKR